MRLRTTVDKARHQEIRGRVRPPDLVVEIEVRVPDRWAGPITEHLDLGPTPVFSEPGPDLKAQDELCACIGVDCAEKGCWAKRNAWIPNLRLSEDEMRKELGWPASPSQ